MSSHAGNSRSRNRGCLCTATNETHNEQLHTATLDHRPSASSREHAGKRTNNDSLNSRTTDCAGRSQAIHAASIVDPCCTSSRRRTAAHRKPTHRRKHERPSSFTALTLLKCTGAALTHSSGSRRFHAASHRPFLWPSVPSANATPLLSSQPPRSACVQRISSRWKPLQSCLTTPFAQQSHPASLVSSYSPSRSSTARRCGLAATRMQDALDSLNSEADSCLLELIHLADRRSRLSEVPSWINLFTSSPLSPLLLTSRSLRRLLTAATPTTHSSISLH